MRLVLAVLGTSVLLGCSGSSPTPTSPSPAVAPPAPAPPTTGRPASLWIIVVPEGSGACIVGALVEIVGGPGVGQSGTMPEVCDIWWVNGAVFRDLTEGIETTVRASAPGYVTKDVAVLPTLDPGPLRATVIELVKAPNP